ncbi:MAG: 16S rRNA (cytidine(1402)-2'-O)-methyltransferase [Burkholderiaceae bacterium]|nr:16S rRNA (cytidine(1402)-2'-O)-methyltransferase [Burkholderiaceae bacterium]
MTEERPGIGEVGTLYVVATPIGHLSDLGVRAAEVLREVDVVAAEDTRTSRVLLERVGSHARLMAAHRHNEREAGAKIVALLAERRRVALVSDAGTPAVSDPGALIVAMALHAGFRVVPIPGPSAPIALLSACGLVEGPFHFEGFLPTRAKARDARLAALARMPHAFVLFEAPHRIARTLPAIAAACGDARWIAIGRELTKRFEEVQVCRAGDAAAWLAADPNRGRGEYVLVVAAPGHDPLRAGDDAARERSACAGAAEAGEAGEGAPAATSASVDAESLLAALLDELPLSRAVKVAERVTGLPHRTLYQLALAIDAARR